MENRMDPPAILASSHTEPLTLRQILLATWQLCVEHPGPLLAVCIVPWICASVVPVYVSNIFEGIVKHLVMMDVPAVMGFFMLIAAPAIVFFLCAQGAIVHVVSCIYAKKKIVLRHSVIFGLKRIGDYIVGAFIFMFWVGIINSLAFLPVTLVAVFLSPLLGKNLDISVHLFGIALLAEFFVVCRYMLFDKVMTVEGLGSVESLKRSWRLLSGKSTGWLRRNHFKMFILSIVWVGASVCTYWLWAKVLDICQPHLQPLLPDFKQTYRPMLLVFGVFPVILLGSVATTIFYYDIRRHKEGFDPSTVSQVKGRKENQ